jgi:hypothetical protein
MNFHDVHMEVCMDKISSILPSSARVQSVDIDESPPVRPGAPALGRKAGRNTVADRVSLSQKAKEMAAQETLAVRNPKEASRAKMVEELNKKFFETRLIKPEPKEAPQSQAIAENLPEVIEEAPVRYKESMAAQYEPAIEEGRVGRLSVEA